MAAPDTGGGGTLAFTNGSISMANASSLELTARTRAAIPYAALSDTYEKVHPGDVITAATVVTQGFIDPLTHATAGEHIELDYYTTNSTLDTVTLTLPGTGGDQFVDDGFISDEGSTSLQINELILFNVTVQLTNTNGSVGWASVT